MTSKSLGSLLLAVVVAACSADAGGTAPSSPTGPSGGGDGTGEAPSTGPEGTGGGGGDTTEPALDSASCSERCEAKATSCGAPSSMLASICGYYCGQAMTESEMSCLENESCSALQSKSTSCLGSSGTTGGSTGGGSTTGGGTSSGGGGTSSGSGTTKTCSSTKTCTADAKAVTSCTVVSGIPVETTTTCSNGTCKNGECGYCSKASDCSTMGYCKCQDKQTVYTTVEATCRSGKCSQSSPNCATLCKDHGGPT